MAKVLVEIRGGNVIYTGFTDPNIELVIIDHDNPSTGRECACKEVNLFSDPELEKYVQENGYEQEPASIHC